MALAIAMTSGCAVRRMEDGVYRSSKGYRVTIPGPDWTIVDSSPADLELRHRDGEAGMLVNAVCGSGAAQRSPRLLERQLTAGLRGRDVIERSVVSVNGRQAARAVVEAGGPQGARTRLETYVIADGRCVYDLIYAAPSDWFEAWRDDFTRFVGTFVTEQE